MLIVSLKVIDILIVTFSEEWSHFIEFYFVLKKHQKVFDHFVKSGRGAKRVKGWKTDWWSVRGKVRLLEVCYNWQIDPSLIVDKVTFKMDLFDKAIKTSYLAKCNSTFWHIFIQLSIDEYQLQKINYYIESFFFFFFLGLLCLQEKSKAQRIKNWIEWKQTGHFETWSTPRRFK